MALDLEVLSQTSDSGIVQCFVIVVQLDVLIYKNKAYTNIAAIFKSFIILDDVKMYDFLTNV